MPWCFLFTQSLRVLFVVLMALVVSVAVSVLTVMQIIYKTVAYADNKFRKQYRLVALCHVRTICLLFRGVLLLLLLFCFVLI